MSDTGQNQEVMMNNRRLLQLQRRQCEGAESAKSAGGKTELSANALSDTLPFGVKFFVCFEAKRNHDSKITWALFPLLFWKWAGQSPIYQEYSGFAGKL